MNKAQIVTNGKNVYLKVEGDPLLVPMYFEIANVSLRYDLENEKKLSEEFKINLTEED